MLNWCSSRQIDDEVFGKLEYKRYLFQANFWKGKTYFPPASKEVDIYIISGKRGISKTQRSFYLDLIAKYKDTPEIFYNNIPNAFEFCHGTEYTKKHLNSEKLRTEFVLDRVFIPSFDDADAFWEISYIYKAWNESFTLFFHDWKFMFGECDD